MATVKRILCLGLFASTVSLNAQKETANWYFGYNAGLTFSTSPPTILTNGALSTLEGCATVSDAAGNLLFYTNGVAVYDRSHSVMANGTGLGGHFSTTQSALAIKKPGSASLYYVFTLYAGNCDTMRYSIVDMSLAAGMGSVTVKNTLLATCMTERCAGVSHCNGVDFWIVVHKAQSDDFYAYLLTSSGVSTTPVISTVGSVHNSAIGNMRISPTGKKLGLTHYIGNPTLVELFDFDNATGIVSNPVTLLTGSQLPYGCEFSPDGTRFYATSYTRFFQWDLCAGSGSAIVASQYSVTAPNVYGMQAAMDGMIYVARGASQTIGVIQNPNVYGSGLNYVSGGQSVGTATCQLGLPNFISSQLRPAPAPFTFTQQCQVVSFTATQTNYTVNAGCSALTKSVTGLSWDFGDPASGALNVSGLATPSHTFSGPGNYTVTQVLQYDCESDTIRLPVSVVDLAPTLSVTGNFNICAGDKRTYSVTGASNYVWTGGIVTSTNVLSPTITTVYSVVGTGSTGCQSTRQFTITVGKCTGLHEINPVTVECIPNPAMDKVEIFTGSPLDVEVLNNLGVVLIETRCDGSCSIDIRLLPAGMYFVRASDGRTAGFTRLIKSE